MSSARGEEGQWFVYTLIQDARDVDATVKMLVSYGERAGAWWPGPTGAAVLEPILKLLRDSSGGYYGGSALEGGTLEFIDRFAALDGFAETINSAIVGTLASAVAEAKREVHREKGMNVLEAPCAHGQAATVG